jgi:hypothetical protein
LRRTKILRSGLARGSCGGTGRALLTRAKARVLRSQLYRDLRHEANVLTKKLRPLLEGFRLGAVTMALAALESEQMVALLAAEAEGCDCFADAANGMYKCESRAKHALTTEAGR